MSSIDAHARCRHAMLTRANQLLTNTEPVPFAERFDALPTMTGLFMTALEELKLAEDELRDQNAQLIERRVVEDRKLTHYHELFLSIPLAVIVTDIYATIIETNHTAENILGRGGKHLVRKPLADLLDSANREVFRRQLARITNETVVTRWELCLHRTGDVPLVVEAAVQMVPAIGPTGSGVLLWLMQPKVADN